MRILACGAHADDVEIFCGGTVALSAQQGHEVMILDLTAGEMGSNGTVEERRGEAERAAAILGAKERFNCGLPDGFVDAGDREQRRIAVEYIREIRPEVMLIPVAETRHPDHGQAGRLLKEAAYVAGLKKYPAAGEPFRPVAVFHYLERRPGRPDFLVPVADQIEQKRGALLCFESQFKRGGQNTETFINHPDFLEGILARDRFYGAQAGVNFAEPFQSWSPPLARNLADLLP
jgi:N-acetylglucosamine malate deacetylase 1